MSFETISSTDPMSTAPVILGAELKNVHYLLYVQDENVIRICAFRSEAVLRALMTDERLAYFMDYQIRLRTVKIGVDNAWSREGAGPGEWPALFFGVPNFAFVQADVPDDVWESGSPFKIRGN
jgi:hypothetical protein